MSKHALTEQPRLTTPPSSIASTPSYLLNNTLRLAGTHVEDMTKSWNGLEDATAPVKTRWRAVSATFVTLVCLAAVDTIFPGLKNWDASFLNKEPVLHDAPFDWSKVR